MNKVCEDFSNKPMKCVEPYALIPNYNVLRWGTNVKHNCGQAGNRTRVGKLMSS